MGLDAPYAKSRPLAIEEAELDAPGQGEVLVKIGAAGLCHSDLSVIEGNRPRPVWPVLRKMSYRPLNLRRGGFGLATFALQYSADSRAIGER